MTNNNKYCEYIEIDEEYFPQVNEFAIYAASPDFWTHTYPHPMFIEMLNKMERVLARQEKRSIWIEGAYGTGKSMCAHALEKILEVPEEELRAYWDKYEPLKKKTDLLEKLIGHKKNGIVTAHRYASGMINSPRDLFFAVQETLKVSLEKAELYAGEGTLKESVIAWIDEPTHKKFFNNLLEKTEWKVLFTQTSADEVLSALRKGGNIKTLMDNIFRLADEEGITALNIDADRLIAWLKDIIDHNNVKVVFIWDEFSDYFKNNQNTLSEFQRLVELVNQKPFYFIVVTHESGHLFATGNATWKKVRDRFITVQITMPDSTAFILVSQAFNAKSAAEKDWESVRDDLNARLDSSRTAIIKAIDATDIDDQVMKRIMPLHPMTVLFLKNISSAFKSNQRSMFDFIKSSYSADDVKAFQWFIENTGPHDDHPLLTVDMLWDFFYEKGKDNITLEIRLIMDIFPQQQNLREDEKAVLKAILIMQAIDWRLRGTIDLFKATEQNLSYVFEGIPDLEGTKSANLAKGLKKKGILVSNLISGGQYAYAAAVLAGDQAKIDSYEKDIRQKSTTSKLVTEGRLSTVLSLSSALRLRFESEPGTGEIMSVTTTDFTSKINSLRNRATGWNFHAVIAFARDDTEAENFRKTLRTVVADKQYENIVFIDALSTPLGLEAFDRYVTFSAMAMYYQGSNNTSSRENSDKAKHVLDQDWKNRIHNGQFVVYTYTNQEGEKLGNAKDVANSLQIIVMDKFQYVFDFNKGITESQLKMTPAMKQSAKSGILQATSGVVKGVESHLFPSVWGIDRYWENPTTASLPISKIKVEVDKRIEVAFASYGRISIDKIYGFLEKTYGFAPCNLSSFIAGFLLKEYSSEPFHYNDSSGGHEQMTQDKLAEMLKNYIGKSPKLTYIAKMTADEKAFYELTEKAWKIPGESFSSAGQVAIVVSTKMRGLKLPVWCLEEVDTSSIFDVVQKYIELVQKEDKGAHDKAAEIGKIASKTPSLADSLSALLTSENCQNGMRKYLRSFDNGKVMELATVIGAENNVLGDICDLFEVKHSCLWDKQTGEDEIRKLQTEYSVVKESNALLNIMEHSLTEAYKKWRDRLNFISISCEALRAKYPALEKVFGTLLKICKQEDILPEQLKAFHAELVVHGEKIREFLNNGSHDFVEVYEPYLENLNDNDIKNVKSKLLGLFELSKTDCNIKVKEAAEEFRKSQLKSKLSNSWKDKTETKNPRDWSSHYRMPILCCVSETEYEKAKKAFEICNNLNWGTDSEIKDALSFLDSTTLFDIITDDEKRNAAFKRDIIGEYSILLPDINKVRDALDHLSVDTYDWCDNPSVKGKVKKLAEAEYNAGGSDKVLLKIDAMDDAQLKQYLKLLVKDSITVGIGILINGGGK